VTLVGVAEPRLYTPPLRDLDKSTSAGWEVEAFARIVLQLELDPWQAWFLRHALELNEDGTFRFRTVLLLVARQNGKTTVMQVLTMWALFTRAMFVVGTAQDLSIAREAWDAVRFRIRDDPELAAWAPRGHVSTANGKEQIRLVNGGRYIVKATTADAGRGIPGVGLVLMDELRTHTDWAAWAALSNTTMAVPNALIVGMSNAGTDDSVVLNELRDLALAGTDPSLGLFEYSAPPECDLEDREGWRQANPSLGHGRLTERALESAMRKSPAAIFRTENLCQRVETLDTAIDSGAWRNSRDPVDVAEYREAPMYGGLDVSRDGARCTLVIGTPVGGGRARVWVAKAWESVDLARAQLPDVLAALDLRRLAWNPSGPAAELAPVIRAAGRRKGSSRGTVLVEVNGVALSEACMGLAGTVRSRGVLHSGDPLLDAQLAGCARLWQGDRFVFTRRGAGHAEAAYALALAVHAILTAPKPRPRWTLEDDDA
jgi:hypothetical protein